MPKVSQYHLDDKRVKELIGQLWNAFAFLKNRSEVKTFLPKFFTPGEVQMFAKRLELLKLADSDLEVTQLQKFTGVAKVTVYEWLEKHDSYEKDFHLVIDRLKDSDKDYLQRLKDKIDRTSIVYKGYVKRQKRRVALITTQ